MKKVRSWKYPALSVCDCVCFEPVGLIIPSDQLHMSWETMIFDVLIAVGLRYRRVPQACSLTALQVDWTELLVEPPWYYFGPCQRIDHHNRCYSATCG